MASATGLNHILRNHIYTASLYRPNFALNTTAAALYRNTPPSFTGGVGYNCDINTTGNMLFGIPLTGTFYLYDAEITYNHTLAGTFPLGSPVNSTIADRLWACSGFVFNTSGNQNVVTPGILPARDFYNSSSGFGCEIWTEGYAVCPNITSTLTITYTDPYGNTGLTGTVSYTNQANTYNMRRVLMQNGHGVSSIQSFRTSSTGGATLGNIGVTILKRVCEIPAEQHFKNIFNSNILSLGVPLLTTGHYMLIENAGELNVGNITAQGFYLNLKLGQP